MLHSLRETLLPQTQHVSLRRHPYGRLSGKRQAWIQHQTLRLSSVSYRGSVKVGEFGNAYTI